MNSVKRVTDITSEIAAASIEQSEGINQVNSAIASMDEVTQQNAALVEEAAAAAESLVDQSNELNNTVSVFNVNQELADTPLKENLEATLSIVKSEAKVSTKAA